MLLAKKGSPRMATKLPPIVKKVTSWSYSTYAAHKKCARAYRLDYLSGLPKEAKSTALQHGIDVHGLAENYIRGVGPATLPSALKAFGSEFKRLRAKRKTLPSSVIIEDQWAFAKGWGPSVYNDWVNCWLRVKLDLAERVGDTVTITDVKTGKYREDNNADYAEQLELYGLTTLLKFPGSLVTARLLYVDAARVYPDPSAEVSYQMRDLPALKKTWETRVKPMFNDTKFPPRPQFLCRFCRHSKENGGVCDY
jgi:hypothetical protein